MQVNSIASLIVYIYMTLPLLMCRLSCLFKNTYMLSFILKVLYFISMSDILSPVTNLKFQDFIHLTTDHSPKFVNKLSVDTTAVALTLEISSHFFF
jgi:hypothetical protein